MDGHGEAGVEGGVGGGGQVWRGGGGGESKCGEGSEASSAACTHLGVPPPCRGALISRGG